MKWLLQTNSPSTRPRTRQIAVLSAMVVVLVVLLLTLLLIDPKAAAAGARPIRIVTFAILASMICLEFTSCQGASRNSTATRPPHAPDSQNENESKDLRETSISMMYYRHIQRRHLLLGILLLTGGQFLYIGSELVGRTDPVTIACVLTILPLLYALTSIRRAILHSRVISGLFGTNELEVREFVDFMAKHYRRVNLSGGGGASIPTLLPERRRRPSSSADGIAEILR